MVSIEIDADIRIAQVQLDEAEMFFTLVDSNRAHLRRCLSWIDETRLVADVANHIETCLREAAAGTALYCGIYERDVPVGVCSYNHIDQRNRTARIGYWLAAGAQGRGIMSRSVSAFVDYGFTQRSLHRQVIACAEGNRASAAVAERCGFRLEGVARDAEWLYDHFVSHRIYSRLRTDA